jgi:hypothetical protein
VVIAHVRYWLLKSVDNVRLISPTLKIMNILLLSAPILDVGSYVKCAWNPSLIAVIT